MTNFDFQSQLSSVKRIECPNLDQLVQDSAESSQRLTMWWWQSQIHLDSCSASILCVCVWLWQSLTISNPLGQLLYFVCVCVCVCVCSASCGLAVETFRLTQYLSVINCCPDLSCFDAENIRRIKWKNFKGNAIMLMHNMLLFSSRNPIKRTNHNQGGGIPCADYQYKLQILCAVATITNYKLQMCKIQWPALQLVSDSIDCNAFEFTSSRHKKFRGQIVQIATICSSGVQIFHSQKSFSQNLRNR